jgi:hypothetical protein
MPSCNFSLVKALKSSVVTFVKTPGFMEREVVLVSLVQYYVEGSMYSNRLR